MTIRAIGEMQPHNAGSRVTLDPGPAEQDEFGVQRALVAIADPRNPSVRATNPKAARDFELWGAMDQASKDVAKVFGVAPPPEPARDGLGTTHHETGGLYMGSDASDSVTLTDARLRHTTNAYVVGPFPFPTIGSPNPMLTGVALARRLGDRLASPTPSMPDPVPGAVQRVRHRLVADDDNPQPAAESEQPGFDAGDQRDARDAARQRHGDLLRTEPTPENFILRLQWLRWHDAANSGVSLRFPDPSRRTTTTRHSSPTTSGSKCRLMSSATCRCTGPARSTEKTTERTSKR